MKIKVMKNYLFCLFAFIHCTANCQNVTLLKATSQHWAGGVAGHHGNNYLISIESSDTTIAPDTIWIGQDFYKIRYVPGDTVTRKINKSIKTVTYNLYAGESYNDMRRYYYHGDTVKNGARRPTKNYTGAAAVSYRYKHKQYLIIVKSFQVLPGLNYP